MKTLKTALLVACALSIAPWLAGSPGALAATPEAAAPKPGWYPQIVDLDFVREHAVIPRRKDVVIVDSRPKARRYDKGHIPGAVSIPEREFDKLAPTMLPADKATLLVFYCGGYKCMLSHKSAFKAEALGYGNVKVYAAGEPEWRNAGLVLGVSPAYVKKLLDTNENFVLVDSRPKKRRYDKGHIPGAISISDREFKDLAPTMLPADKTTPLVFYCGGYKCKLSPSSAEKAKALGYSNVRVMHAGYPAWVKAYGHGDKSTAAPAKAKVAIGKGKEPGTITVESFNTIMAESPDSVLLIDVRDAEEYASGALAGSVNIPINDFEARIDTLPGDRPIIFLCGTGARSGEAYDMVQMFRQGLEVYFIDAEMEFNADGSYSITPASV